MTASTMSSSELTPERRHEQRKVLAGTLVGTSIEWYDFFIYAQATGLVLGPLFLAPLDKSNPGLSQVLAFATIGISFLFRPLGAILAGHLGDKWGRKSVLVMTLILMGLSTALIGVLPSYATIGLWAPLLLIVLRVLQGFSAGGEWGGAALMSVEHAPKNKRSLFGAYPQIGVPIGMILATLVTLVLQLTLGKDAFMEWAWRITFLFSIVLVLVGYIVRRTVEESPVFKELQQRQKDSSAPLGRLFVKHTKEVVLAALIFIANNAAGYLLIAFFITYLTKRLGMDSIGVLLTTTLGSTGWLIFTLVGGWMGDKIGRVRTFQIGYLIVLVWVIPMWFLIDAKSLGLYFIAAFVLTIGLGLSYGPQAALYSEMFPADVRYSGVSIGYAIGAILGGAFAPMISEAILNASGVSWHIGIYLAAITVISLVSVSLVKDKPGRDLNVASADWVK
jgi:MFS family permease